MRHYVLVIADDVSEVEQLMAPYSNTDETYFTSFTSYEMDQTVAEQRETYELDWTHIYESFEDYADETYGAIPDPVTGLYGEWYNMEGRWDAWGIIEDPDHTLPTLDGQTSPICQVKDLSFEPRMDWYQEAIREWEVIKEEQALRPYEDEVNFLFDIPDFYPDKETYASHHAMGAHYVSGIIMNDEWIECGSCYKPVEPETTNKLHEILQTIDPEKLVILVVCVC